MGLWGGFGQFPPFFQPSRESPRGRFPPPFPPKGSEIGAARQERISLGKWSGLSSLLAYSTLLNSIYFLGVSEEEEEEDGKSAAGGAPGWGRRWRRGQKKKPHSKTSRFPTSSRVPPSQRFSLWLLAAWRPRAPAHSARPGSPGSHRNGQSPAEPEPEPPEPPGGAGPGGPARVWARFVPPPPAGLPGEGQKAGSRLGPDGDPAVCRGGRRDREGLRGSGRIQGVGKDPGVREGSRESRGIQGSGGIEGDGRRAKGVGRG